MERAAVLIGVRKTGNLPELQAVTTGVQQMAGWARSQGIDGARLKILTDDSGEVRIHQITDAIEELVDLTTVEQLIVYFSGHGVNNFGEYWLLPRAPKNPNEAINVEGSKYLAACCGIKHVVLIADACRTAAEGIEAEQVKGQLIFPSVAGMSERPVDTFYACSRGKPALEIKDPKVTASEFSALYTEVLVECLLGQHPEVLKYEDDGTNDAGLVLTEKLGQYLESSVPTRLRKKLGSTSKVSQTPYAQVNSRDTWLSHIPRLSRTAAPVTPVSRATAINPFTISAAMVSHAIAGDLGRWQDMLTIAGDIPEASSLKDAAVTLATPFGPSHFETRCGFKLRGGKVAQVFCNDAPAEILDDEGTIVRVGQSSKPAAVVLLQLRNGTGVAIPAIPDFIAELTFEDNTLTDVSYEPSDNTGRWNEYVTRREELRTLRASIAASVGLGAFRLSGDSALQLARRMQLAKGVDPSLALYAGYAYHDLQRRDLIKQMQSYLQGDLGFAFFDLSLLAGDRPGDHPGPNKMSPPFPLLSQGWSLLSALQAKLPGSLQTLYQHLLPSSLWTMFDEAGVATLAAALTSGEIQ